MAPRKRIVPSKPVKVGTYRVAIEAGPVGPLKKAIGKGLGLGLSISYGIVRDLGGQIHVSNPPEGGAEIVVELPRHHPKSSFEHA